MKKRYSMRRGAAAALVAAVLIVGCGKDQDSDALLASAKVFLSKNDNNAAIIQLRNALQKDPDLAEARFLLGRALLVSGDVRGAEKELRIALELQYPAEDVVPPYARSLVLLGDYDKVIGQLSNTEVRTAEAKAELMTAVGQAHAMLKNPEGARTAFAAALAAKPGYAAAQLGQARLMASAGKFAEAATMVDTALQTSPANHEAWQLKGDLLLRQKELDPALDAFRKAVEAKPDLLAAHFMIVTLLVRQNKPGEAAKQVSALKTVAPKHPQTLYLQALVASLEKNFPEARLAIQEHLRVAPDNVRGLLLAGSIETELKAYAQAEAHFQKVLIREPQHRGARRALIISHMRNRQISKAMDALTPVLGAIEKDAGMLALAGEVFMVSGDPARGAQYLAKAAALDPGDARKRTALALSHMATGEPGTAVRELEQAAALDPGIRADLALIASHMQRREHDKALAAIERLEKKQPGTPLAHNLRGGVLLAKRDAAGARRSFERALEMDAANFPASARLAELDLSEKKPDAAQQRFETVLAKDPKNMQALLGLAALRSQGEQAASRTGVDEAVVALVTKAITAHPTEPAPRLTLIRYYLYANDAKKAVLAAQAALAAIPDRPAILEAAGRAFQAAGDTNQALTVYRKLIPLQRESPLPYLRMAEVQLAAKNKEDALGSLRKALAIKPDLLEAQRGVISIHMEDGRAKEALSVAQEIQKQRPKESIGYIFEGDVHAVLKQWPQAVSTYRAGLKHVAATDLAARLHGALGVGSGSDADRFAATWLKDHPKDTAFRLYLAQAGMTKKDYAGAAQQYRALLEIDSNNALVLNNLAWVEGQLKDPKALGHAEQANKLAPNQPAIMDTLAGLLIKSGDTARGLELMQKASAMAPQAAGIRLNLAKALIEAGKKDAARKELDELAKLGETFPGHSEVTQLRRGL